MGWEAMSKVTMPEPVAWLIDWPDEPGLGHYFAEEPASNCRSQPLITTEQAESYATAKVREALEGLLHTLETRQFDGGQQQILSHVRSLIPKE